jgi:hypothetical protein
VLAPITVRAKAKEKITSVQMQRRKLEKLAAGEIPRRRNSTLPSPPPLFGLQLFNARRFIGFPFFGRNFVS